MKRQVEDATGKAATITLITNAIYPEKYNWLDNARREHIKITGNDVKESECYRKDCRGSTGSDE